MSNTIVEQGEVYLLRHGETTWNVQHKLQGHNNESQLTEKGEEQIHQFVENFRPCLENKQITIWSSDLVRAHTTAKIIAKGLGIAEEQIHLDSSLREANFGQFEGTNATHYKTHPDFLRYQEDQFRNAMDPINLSFGFIL